MADYGLLGGIGQGLQQGLLMYQKTKQLNRENQIQNLTSGVQQDADGNLTLSPMKQQQQQMQQTQADEFNKSHDATSQKSQNSRAFSREALSKSVPGIDVNKAIPDTMSDADLASESSPVKGLIQGGLGMQGSQIKAQGMIQASNGKNQSFADRDSTSVSKDYESTMKPYRQVNEDVAKIEATLNTKDKDGKPLITPQQMGDVNAAIARIYSPNHMSDATVSRTEYESAPSQFAAALQKWTADPQDIGSRNLVDHIVDQAHHLANVSNQNAGKELDNLDSGYQNLQVPSALKTAQDKSSSFRKKFSTQYQEAGAPSQGGLLGGSQPSTPGGLIANQAHPQDQAAIAWAQANPNDPRSAAILKANGVQ